jgi:hypothetical protein
MDMIKVILFYSEWCLPSMKQYRYFQDILKDEPIHMLNVI